jgi:hypothetical protein
MTRREPPDGQYPHDQIEAALSRTNETTPRSYRTVTVTDPWGWVWLPGDRPLVDANPDATDDRLDNPRRISTAEVDWLLVLHAVRHAVSGLPNDSADLITLNQVQVETVFPLTDTEYEIVSSWVGSTDRVTYSPDDDTVTGGRHRLWFTQPHQLGYDVPVFDEHLHYLTAARADPAMAATSAATIAEELAWLKAQSGSGAARDAVHQSVLARLHVELTAPEPVPSWVFYPMVATTDEQHLTELAALVAAGRADDELLREVLPNAWRYKTERIRLDPAVVCAMFRRLGYTVDGRSARPPGGTRTLYRGATKDHRAGCSWTLDPGTAAYFASQRQDVTGSGRVWVAEVPASRLLAYLSDESEFIVDLAGAEDLVRLAEPPFTRRRRTAGQLIAKLRGRPDS